MCHVLRKICDSISPRKDFTIFLWKVFIFSRMCLVQDFLAEVRLSVPSASGVLKPKLGLAPGTGSTTFLERSSCLIDLWSTRCLSKCPPPSYSSAEQVQYRGKTNNKHFCVYPVCSSYSIVALTLLFVYAKLERERGRLEKEPLWVLCMGIAGRINAWK